MNNPNYLVTRSGKQYPQNIGNYQGDRNDELSNIKSSFLGRFLGISKFEVRYLCNKSTFNNVLCDNHRSRNLFTRITDVFLFVPFTGYIENFLYGDLDSCPECKLEGKKRFGYATVIFSLIFYFATNQNTTAAAMGFFLAIMIQIGTGMFSRSNTVF